LANPANVNYPDLIFLINFGDMEYACIEQWLTDYRKLNGELDYSRDPNVVEKVKKIISL
jgi:hypothetical protein